MSDEELRVLERADWRDPRALRAATRQGAPKLCIWCSHALTGEAACAWTREWLIGEVVRHEGVAVGSYLGDKHVIINSQVGVPGFRGTIELPEAWKPAPCGCDHSTIPEERTREAYERAHGCGIEAAKHLRHGDVLYHIVNRNADRTPQRWRVNGQIKLWKRRPDRFQVPLKHGMYSHGYLNEENCKSLRTQEEWAK